MADDRVQVLDGYRKKLRELRELEARLKSNRESVTDLVKEFNTKALVFCGVWVHSDIGNS